MRRREFVIFLGGVAVVWPRRGVRKDDEPATTYAILCR
jgi:hypothetical protein